MLPLFQHLNLYYGDLHSHCNVGYGHGSLADALQNAQLQLDFACITPHAHWADLPDKDGHLATVVEYHEQGFARTAAGWSQVQERVDEAYEPGRFVTFLGQEWHSLAAGDYNIYFKEPPGEIVRATDLSALKEAMARWQERGREVMLIPHHIGYRQGYRGINWHTFSGETSPVVEIMSMHGASESADAAYPYLHTMGPRDGRSTYHYGLAQGHLVGAIGSTDHHSAHPGSYGHGRLAVWAPSLTRTAIWEAIQARRTVALTGDNIRLAFSLNESIIGDVALAARTRQLVVAVEGGAAIDTLELLHNNEVLVHHAGRPVAGHPDPFAGPLKIHVEVGWGRKGEDVDWEVELAVQAGTLLAVEPRFRGHEVVAPQAEEAERYVFSRWEQSGNRLSFATRTWGNPTTTTASTQGVSLTVSGGPQTALVANFNGQVVTVSLAELVQGSRSGYLGGFLTPAYLFHRAVPRAAYSTQFSHTHHAEGRDRDWYTVRVRQHNGQWAWSSPIWVEGSG